MGESGSSALLTDTPAGRAGLLDPRLRTAAFENTPATCANISLNDSDHGMPIPGPHPRLIHDSHQA
jgi:hypothetical protein